MAVIRIDYDDGNINDLKYESVRISYGITSEKTFASGNFVKDWFDCKKFFALEIENEFLLHSSSVDHFIMDGAPYDSVYLKNENDNPYLTRVYDGEGIELFVPKGTLPTWEELKEMCK
jgi:hypothetical protein